MLSLFQRIRNLWQLSAFRVQEVAGEKKLVKDIYSHKKQLAKIVPDKEVDLLNEDIQEA